MNKTNKFCDVCAGAMTPPFPAPVYLHGAGPMAGHRELDVCDGCAETTTLAKLRIIAATPQTTEPAKASKKA